MTTSLRLAIQFAGLLHFLIAAANFIAPRMLHYRENLARVSPIIRQIFHVHATYIVLVLVGFGVICLLFPGDLMGASRLGRFLCGFLALFWALRVAVQLGFYDRTTKAKHPVGNFLFSGIFLYLLAVFATATFFGT
jgi:hypothetical protein